MAESSTSAETNGHEHQHGSIGTCPSCNGAQTEINGELEDANEVAAIENTFQIAIRLPHEPYKTQTIVSTQDQAQDVRQSIIDTPHTFQYSCFHLEKDGERIPDYVDLADIPSIAAGVELTLVEDPYNEKDARIHVLRVRDLIGASGDRINLSQGIQSGLTLHDHVVRSISTQTGTSAAPSTTNGHHEASASTVDAAGSHPMSNYDFDAPASLDVLLLPPDPEPMPKTLKSLALSQWNPPPYNLRCRGHLLYLQVTTNEGEQYQITSHSTGFYVNKSSNTKFDPSPRLAPKAYRAHSLLTLLSRISPSFDASFRALQEYNGKNDPLSTFQPPNVLPANPWLVSTSMSNLSAHLPDFARSQESYLITGTDNAENLRDWNEEFQTLKELPRETVQDRVFRERATSKLFADYTEAATAGAVLIARGEVAPLNPTENRDAQIFVYNNVFFSFGADGVGTFTNEGGDEAARVATGKDVSGVRVVNQLDLPGLSSPGTVVVDLLGRRLVGQSIVPGIFRQREPTDQQIDYGGVEGKDVVAEDKTFAPLFEKLAKAMRTKRHPVWDKDGKVHELETSVETKGLLGTDGRRYALDLYRLTPLDVDWIEKHWKGLPHDGDREEASAESEAHNGYIHRMTVLRPELIDAYWRLKLRQYIGDRLANNNTNNENSAKETKSTETPTLQNGTAEKSVDSDAKANSISDDNDKQETTEEEIATQPETEQARVDISGFDFAFNPDVFSGQQPQTEEDKERWAKDEAEVRAACEFLHTEVLPRLVKDLQDGDVGFPMDGHSLSNLLHKRGINIRYLGKIADLSSTEEPRLQALKTLTVQEMISRAFKHIANTHLRYLPVVFAASCISHLLNCLLGSELNSSPTPIFDDEIRSMYPDADFGFEKVVPATLQHEIVRQVQLRYRHQLPADWVLSVNRIQLLRETSLKLGLQLGSKQFVFTPQDTSSSATNGSATTNGHGDGISAPAKQLQQQQYSVVNGHLSTTNNGSSSGTSGGKKKKRGGDRSPNRAATNSPTSSSTLAATMPIQTFYPDDILNIVPVVKESSPRSMLADEALEAGRISVAQNQRELGQELLLESLSLHEQIYGVLHAEVARAYHTLSTLFYGLDDKAIAVELARKAVIVSERTLGVDSNETLLGYLNLGLFEHAAGNSRLALTYFKHALSLSKIVYGTNHPDSVTTLNNAAVMLQNLKLFHDSRLWFEASLKVCQQFAGKTSVHTATVLFQLAQALALDHDPKAAVNRMREAYNIFNAALGPEDRNTKEAETWLEQLTQNAVSIAKHAKDVQARRMRRLQQMTPGTKVTLQRHVGQTTSEAASPASQSSIQQSISQQPPSTTGGSAGGFDERSIEELLKYIESGDASKTTSSRMKTTHPKRRPQQKV